MKTTVYILLLAACLLSIPCELRPERWYASFSAGNTSSLSGSYEMENFYSPGWSYSLDFGIKVNPYILIMPASFCFGEFGFIGENYSNDFWANKDFINSEFWKRAERHGIDYIYTPVINLQGTSSYKHFSYLPGFMVSSPEFIGTKGYVRICAGVYSGNLAISNHITNLLPNGEISVTTRSGEDKSNRFAMLYGGGLEYNLFDKFGLLFEARCNVVYSGKSNSNLKVEDEVINLYGNPLLFYYMAPEGLRIHRFMEEKNLTTFDLRYGMSFRF